MSERFNLTTWDPELRAPPVPWIINNLWLGRKKIMGLAGAEKSGKSRLLSWMLAGMFANAHRVLGEIVVPTQRPGRVLYLRGEEDQAEIQDRMKQHLELHGLDDVKDVQLPIDFLDAMGMRLDKQGSAEGQRGWFFKTFIQPRQYDLVVVDPLRRVHSGEEKDNTAMSHVHNAMRYWADQYNLGLMIVHHTGKLPEDANMQRIATWFRGNTDFPSLVDGALFLEVLKDEGKRRRLKMLRDGRKRFGGPLLIDDYGDDQGFFAAGVVQ